MLCPALVCAGNGKEWRPVRMHWTMTRVILRSFICRRRESFDDNDVSNSIAKPPKEPRQKQHNRNPKNYVCIRMPALLNVKYRRCTSPEKKILGDISRQEESEQFSFSFPSDSSGWKTLDEDGASAGPSDRSNFGSPVIALVRFPLGERSVHELDRNALPLTELQNELH